MEGHPAEWTLVVGLGNPGAKHSGNRHNAGFHCLDRLASAYQLVFDKKQCKAEVAIGRLCGRRAILAKPQTYVNDSGLAVGALAHFYRVDPGDLIVIYDDLDLGQGTIRVRPGGSSGGHNGIKSIIEQIGTASFARIRVGIGRPPGRMPPKAYVLQDYSPAELEVMEETYDRVIGAVETIIEHGVAAAMNGFNARPKEDGTQVESSG